MHVCTEKLAAHPLSAPTRNASRDDFFFLFSCVWLAFFFVSERARGDEDAETRRSVATAMVPTEARRAETATCVPPREERGSKPRARPVRSGEPPARRAMARGKFGSSSRAVTTSLASRSRSSRTRERSSPRLGNAELPACATTSRWQPPATRSRLAHSPRGGPWWGSHIVGGNQSFNDFFVILFLPLARNQNFSANLDVPHAEKV